MLWKVTINRRVALSALATGIGLAGIPEDVSTWIRWLGGPMISLDSETYRWIFVIAGFLLFFSPRIWGKLKTIPQILSAPYKNKRLTSELLKLKEMAKDLIWVYGSLHAIESYVNSEILNEDDFGRWANLSQTKMAKIRKNMNILRSRYNCNISDSEYKFTPYSGTVFNESHRKEIHDMQEPRYRLEKLENHLSVRILQTLN